MTTELTPMQAELLKRSEAIMDSLGKTISSAVDFSKEQIPDIAYQYIAFERAYTSVTLLCGIAFIVLALFLTRYALNTKWSRDLDTKLGLSAIAGVCSGIIGLITFFASLKVFLLVWFAPKVFLLQSLTSLIKG